LETVVKCCEEALELTPVEEELYFSLVFNREKEARGERFVREGMNRRQDHGCRGNSCQKGTNRFIKLRDERFGDDDAPLLIKRKDFRAAGSG
jgi:hypothetical protein